MDSQNDFLPSDTISQEIEQWAEIDERNEWENLTEGDPPIALTNSKSKPLRAAKIEYTNILKPYPDTDPNGYAYVIHVGSQSVDEVKEMWHDVSTK
jgi:hypothetical protein